MTEYDYWKIFPKMPKKVSIGDITVRDGFQHEEKFISTNAKIFYAGEMILAGAKEIEVTNLGSPEGIPQFRDAEQVLTALRSDGFKKRCERKGINYDGIVMTAVTIREPAVDRAIELRKKRNRSRSCSDDGLYRSRTPFCQFRHDSDPILERG